MGDEIVVTVRRAMSDAEIDMITQQLRAQDTGSGDGGGGDSIQNQHGEIVVTAPMTPEQARQEWAIAQDNAESFGNAIMWMITVGIATFAIEAWLAGKVGTRLAAGLIEAGNIGANDLMEDALAEDFIALAMRDYADDGARNLSHIINDPDNIAELNEIIREANELYGTRDPVPEFDYQ